MKKKMAGVINKVIVVARLGVTTKVEDRLVGIELKVVKVEAKVVIRPIFMLF